MAADNADGFDREAGIKAIIALQKLTSIDETREQAEAGWDGMSEPEKRTTMQAYKELCS
jgi:hypothetical protein